MGGGGDCVHGSAPASLRHKKVRRTNTTTHSQALLFSLQAPICDATTLIKFDLRYIFWLFDLFYRFQSLWLLSFDFLWVQFDFGLMIFDWWVEFMGLLVFWPILLLNLWFELVEWVFDLWVSLWDLWVWNWLPRTTLMEINSIAVVWKTNLRWCATMLITGKLTSSIWWNFG